MLPNLRRLADYLMKRERKGNNFQATDLVDQIYLKMVAATDRDWRNKQHFFAITARAMRRYLIDQSRERTSADFVPLEGIENLLPARRSKLDRAVTIDRLLDLAETSLNGARSSKLNTSSDSPTKAAETLSLRVGTMQRMWSSAWLWLSEQIESCHAQQNARG